MTINLIVAILLIIAALIGGAALGMWWAQRQIKKQFGENPMIPLNERVITDMLGSMGQKPNQKQINQIMRKLREQVK